jgi:hypothetical protein
VNKPNVVKPSKMATVNAPSLAYASSSFDRTNHGSHPGLYAVARFASFLERYTKPYALPINDAGFGAREVLFSSLDRSQHYPRNLERVVVRDDEKLIEVFDVAQLTARFSRRSASMFVVGSSKNAIRISDSCFSNANLTDIAAAICSPPDILMNGRS